MKEAGLKRETELDKRAVALEKEQLKAMTEQLENNTKVMKVRFEKMAEEKVQRLVFHCSNMRSVSNSLCPCQE